MANNNDQRHDQQGRNPDHDAGRQQSQHGDDKRQQGGAGNFANDPKRASEAGKKGAAHNEQRRHQDQSAGKQQS